MDEVIIDTAYGSISYLTHAAASSERTLSVKTFEISECTCVTKAYVIRHDRGLISNARLGIFSMIAPAGMLLACCCILQ